MSFVDDPERPADEREADRRARMYSSFEETPDQIAERRRKAREYGLDSGVAPLLTPDDFRRMEQLRDAAAAPPRTKAYIDRPANAAVARDDVKPLGLMEGIWASLNGSRVADGNAAVGAGILLEAERAQESARVPYGIVEAYQVGDLQIKQRQAMSQALAARRAGDAEAVEYWEGVALAYQRQAEPRYLANSLQGFPADVVGAVPSVVNSFVSGGSRSISVAQQAFGNVYGNRQLSQQDPLGSFALAPIAGAAATIGVPGGFFLGMADFSYQQEAGGAYDQYSKLRTTDGRFIDPMIAAEAAHLAGMYSSNVEFMTGALFTIVGNTTKGISAATGTAVLRDYVRRTALREIAKKYGLQIAVGAAGEGSEEVIQKAITEIYGRNIATTRDIAASGGEYPGVDLGKFTSEAAYEFAIGAVLGGTMGAAAVAPDIIADLGAANEADRQARRIEALSSAVQDSKLAKRDPESFKEAVDDIIPGGQVHIDIDAVERLFQSKGGSVVEWAKSLGLNATRLDDARASGFITMSAGEYTSQIARRVIGPEINQHITFDQAVLTPFQGEILKGRLEQIAQETVGEADVKPSIDATDEAAFVAIERQIQQDLDAITEIGGFLKNENMMSARLYAAPFRAEMIARGITEPKEILRRWASVKPRFRAAMREQFGLPPQSTLSETSQSVQGAAQVIGLPVNRVRSVQNRFDDAIAGAFFPSEKIRIPTQAYPEGQDVESGDVIVVTPDNGAISMSREEFFAKWQFAETLDEQFAPEGWGEPVGSETDIPFFDDPPADDLSRKGPFHQFGGEKAVGSPLNTLPVADAMASMGASSEDIWLETGWAQTPDGEWFFEIQGEPRLKLKPTKVVRDVALVDLIEWPELFAAYPPLQDVIVYAKTTSVAEVNGQFVVAGATILRSELRSDFYDKDDSAWVMVPTITVNAPLASADIENSFLGVLTHEIQHGIQILEGWKGLGFWPDLKSFSKTETFKARVAKARATVLEKTKREPTPDEMKDIEEFVAYAIYMENSGEVVARAAARRRSLSEIERAFSVPEYDVAPGSTWATLEGLKAIRSASMGGKHLFDIRFVDRAEFKGKTFFQSKLETLAKAGGRTEQDVARVQELEAAVREAALCAAGAPVGVGAVGLFGQAGAPAAGNLAAAGINAGILAGGAVGAGALVGLSNVESTADRRIADERAAEEARRAAAEAARLERERVAREARFDGVFSDPAALLDLPEDERPLFREYARTRLSKEGAEIISAEAELGDVVRLFADLEGVSLTYLNQMVKRESGGKDTAKNPQSSALGPAQFIKSTWLNEIEKHGDRFGWRQMSSNDTLWARTDRRWASAFMTSYTKDNGLDFERRMGRPATERDGYGMHFMGIDAYVKLLRAAATRESNAARIFPDEAKANRSIFYSGRKPRTAEEVLSNLYRGKSDRPLLTGEAQ